MSVAPATDTGMKKSSLDLNLAYAHDGVASFQQAPALSNGSPLAIMRAPHPLPSENATQRVTKRRHRRKVEAAGSGVNGITPEVVMIQVGEDVTTKIVSFARNGWEVRIMSVHGGVSNVTLCRGSFSQETLLYEGYFEILSLSGSYQPSETNGIPSCTGGLCVSLASPHGRVFGGRVAGALTAASPIQVLLGRFPVDAKNKLKRDASSDIPGASSSTPRGSLSGSSGKSGSPLNQSASGSFSTSSHPVVSNIP